MKKITTIILVCLIYTGTYAQSTKYRGAMENALQLLDTSRTVASYLESANRFERIALAEKTQWLPYYYAALANARAGMQEQSNKVKDDYFDKATALIGKADSLQPNHSEISTVKAMIMQGQIQVNPMSRGSKYGPESGRLLEEAIRLDPSNPRAYLLKGIGLYFTPPMFGGGKEKGCPVIKESLVRYESFTAPDSILPSWGKNQAIYFSGQCQ